MNNESAPTRESNDSAADTVTTDTTVQSTTQPWISRLAIVASIGIFLGLAAQDDYESWETLAKFGYLPADAIWNGGYWALVTSAFVHFGLWHVAFNVYWLWVLGSRLERAIGSLPFLAFFVVSACVSSSFQLAISDGTGIGASGVVYAIFGFMWPTRHRYSDFNDVLDSRTIQIFVIWLVGCVVATYLNVWDVGNAAHISGLLFGGAVAGAFVGRRKPRLMSSALVTLVLLSIIPLFWCPWSVTWLSHKAYDAHGSGQYDAAFDYYSQVIQINPDEAWAYWNRGSVHHALGRSEQALVDMRKACDLDPQYQQSVSWLSHKAYSAHVAGQYEAARECYSQVIQIDPNNAWAYLNRSGVHQALGAMNKAQADLRKAREIDPLITLETRSATSNTLFNQADKFWLEDGLSQKPNRSPNRD